MSLHIGAKKGDVADFVLLPGDPLRAKYIAENYLEEIMCYNTIRGMYGYTGSYKGSRISVQSVGMGMPSMGIYATELIQGYGVETMVRVGSCGAIRDDVGLMDIVLSTGACTDSAMNKVRFNGADFASVPDAGLMVKAIKNAELKQLKYHAGNILTSDFFYNDAGVNDPFSVWRDFGVLAVEMETACLYTIAARYNKKAFSMLTVTDHIISKKSISPDEREVGLDEMIDLALSLA